MWILESLRNQSESWKSHGNLFLNKGTNPGWRVQHWKRCQIILKKQLIFFFLKMQKRSRDSFNFPVLICQLLAMYKSLILILILVKWRMMVVWGQRTNWLEEHWHLVSFFKMFKWIIYILVYFSQDYSISWEHAKYAVKSCYVKFCCGVN